jgi:alpha-L-rhamnosidase
LTWAEASLETQRGEVRVAWKAEDDELTEVDVTVPTGASAVVRLAGRDDLELAPGVHRLHTDATGMVVA